MNDSRMILELGKAVRKGNVAQIGMMIKGWIETATKQGYQNGLEDGYNRAMKEIYEEYDTENTILLTPEMYDELRLTHSYADLERME